RQPDMGIQKTPGILDVSVERASERPGQDLGFQHACSGVSLGSFVGYGDEYVLDAVRRTGIPPDIQAVIHAAQEIHGAGAVGEYGSLVWRIGRFFIEKIFCFFAAELGEKQEQADASYGGFE